MFDNAKWMREDRARNPQKYRDRNNAWASKNRAAKYATLKRWRTNNPEKQRRLAWKQQGLPEPTRPEPKACECCGKVTGKALALDHDHETGQFRGWLCQACNTGIGKLGDNMAGIYNAVRYLTHD